MFSHAAKSLLVLPMWLLSEFGSGNTVRLLIVEDLLVSQTPTHMEPIQQHLNTLKPYRQIANKQKKTPKRNDEGNMQSSRQEGQLQIKSTCSPKSREGAGTGMKFASKPCGVIPARASKSQLHKSQGLHFWILRQTLVAMSPQAGTLVSQGGTFHSGTPHRDSTQGRHTGIPRWDATQGLRPWVETVRRLGLPPTPS